MSFRLAEGYFGLQQLLQGNLGQSLTQMRHLSDVFDRMYPQMAEEHPTHADFPQ